MANYETHSKQVHSMIHVSNLPGTACGMIGTLCLNCFTGFFLASFKEI